jgi:hypothetical protein
MPDDTLPFDPSILSVPVTGGYNQQSAAQPSVQQLSQLFQGVAPATQQTKPSTTAEYGDADTTRSINSLQPDFGDRASQWLDGMRKLGYDPVIHMGYRTPDEQQALYQKSLAGGPHAVSPVTSYHTYGRAFDWVNRAKDGSLQWDNKQAYHDGWKVAQQFGMRGIGDADDDHIQDANYATWKDLPKGDYGNIHQRRIAQQ